MGNLKELLALLAGMAFVVLSVVVVAAAWSGLEHEFGWQIAMVALSVSVLLRVFLPIPVGVYLFAHGVLGFDVALSLSLAVPGLALIFPWIPISIVNGTLGTWRR